MFVLFVLFLWLRSIHIVIVVYYSEECSARSSCTKPHGVTSDNIAILQGTNVIALSLNVIGIKHVYIRNLLMFHTFFKLGDQHCTQTTLGYQYYADRSMLRLVTNITPNAWSLHFMQFLADFMKPAVGEECHVGGVLVTRGDQYHPEGMQPVLHDWLHAFYIWWPVRRWLHVRHTWWPLSPWRHAPYT